MQDLTNRLDAAEMHVVPWKHKSGRPHHPNLDASVEDVFAVRCSSLHRGASATGEAESEQLRVDGRKED